jgi:CubicO group peptidase (beta-lactamase class C family)
VAAIFQMLMNGGNYGGKNYVSTSVVRQYTTRQTNMAHRGLTFDKPSGLPGVSGNTAGQASSQTFGHTGFTGTCVWADPANGLVYVFLSNRVNPTRDNGLLTKNNYRTRIHEAIYKAFVTPPTRTATAN